LTKVSAKGKKLVKLKGIIKPEKKERFDAEKNSPARGAGTKVQAKNWTSGHECVGGEGAFAMRSGGETVKM